VTQGNGVLVDLIQKQERETCASIIDARVKDAEAILRDHQYDAEEVVIELSAYARGLRDAAFAIRHGK
jgi:hypothetical protein